jgi:hypothetical protein
MRISAFLMNVFIWVAEAMSWEDGKEFSVYPLMAVTNSLYVMGYSLRHWPTSHATFGCRTTTTNFNAAGFDVISIGVA